MNVKSGIVNYVSVIGGIHLLYVTPGMVVVVGSIVNWQVMLTL